MKNTKRRITQILLAILAVILIVPPTAQAVGAVGSVLSGGAPTGYLPSGTPVSNAAQFAAMKPEGEYYLTADFRVSATYPVEFTGTLDGNGHTVTISAPLFSSLSGRVKNLTLKGSVSISAVPGCGYAGALANIATGQYVEVVNVANKASVNMTKCGAGGFFGVCDASIVVFNNCLNGSNVITTASACHAGGFIGNATGEKCIFVCCDNDANISGKLYAGGYVGCSSADTSVSDCRNNGSVLADGKCAGGFVGSLEATGIFVRSVNKARVTAATGDTNTGAGGFAGRALSCRFTECDNSGDIKTNGSGNAGGLAGRTAYIAGQNATSAVDCVNSGSVTSGNYAGGLFAYIGVSGNKYEYLIESSLNSGRIQAPFEAGGLVGYCYATGDKSSAYITIQYCANTGDIYFGKAGGAVSWGSYFIAYTNSLYTTIKNNVACGTLGMISGASPYKYSFIGCSSADVANYRISNNYICDGGKFEYYSYASSNDYAKNRISFADAEARGMLKRVDEATLRSTSTLVSLGASKFVSGTKCPIPKRSGTAVKYALNDANGELVISGTGKMDDFEVSAAAPWYNLAGKVKKITVSSGITTVGDRAFESYPAVTSVSLPSGLTYIGKYAFADVGATTIAIPSAVKIIGEGAFIRSGLTSLVLPASLTEINDFAFAKCKKLGNLSMQSGVVTIGENAFYGCSKLESINLPSTLKSIAPTAFSGCEKLKTLTVATSNTVYRAESNCLIDKDTQTIVLGCTGSGAPSGVTAVGPEAFRGVKLASFVLPVGVSTIGERAFENCYYTENIELPDTVSSIGAGAFSRCVSLSEINVPERVTYIGKNAYRDCASVVSVRFDASDADGFDAGHVFDNVGFASDKLTIYIGGNVSSIPAGFFGGSEYVKEVIFSSYDSIVSIGSGAFAGVDFGNIALPDQVVYIGDGAFVGGEGSIAASVGSVAAGYAIENGIGIISVPEVSYPRDGEPVGTAVSTAEQLLAMRPDGKYYLTADITLTSGYEKVFTGVLDGAGHTITLSSPLFGIFGGSVRDLTLRGACVASKDTSDNAALAVRVVGNASFENIDSYVMVYGGYDSGALIGYAEENSVAVIKNCVNNGEIRGKNRVGGLIGCFYGKALTIENCKNYDKVVSTGGYAAGIVARFGKDDGGIAQELNVSGCFNNAYVEGVNGQTAGIVGYTVGKVILTDCRNRGRIVGGSVAGGILGTPGGQGTANSIRIDGCINYGAVSGCLWVGGIAGKLGAVDASKSAGYFIENSANEGNVHADLTKAGTAAGVGGIAGYVRGGSVLNGIENCYNVGKITAVKLTVTTNACYAAGLVGCFSVSGYTVRNCFNAGAVSSVGSNIKGYALYCNGGTSSDEVGAGGNNYLLENCAPEYVGSIGKDAAYSVFGANELGTLAGKLNAGAGAEIYFDGMNGRPELIALGTVWSLEGDTLTVEAGNTDYSNFASAPWFEKAGSAEKVIIKNSVASIGDSALTALTRVTAIKVEGNAKLPSAAGSIPEGAMLIGGAGVKEYAGKFGRAYVDGDKLAIVSARLALGRSISVIYTVMVPEVYGLPSAVCDFRDRSYALTASEADDLGFREFVFDGILPQYMSDAVDLSVTAEKAGVTETAEKKDYSVRKYCTGMLASHGSDEKLCDLLNALLTYGDEAQKYAGHNVSDLSGVSLPDYAGWSAARSVREIKGTQSDQARWSYAALGLAGTVELRLGFKSTDVSGLTVELDYDGRKVVLGESDFERDGDGYVAILKNITADKFGETVKAVFKKNGEPIGAELIYSVDSYLYAKKDDGGFSSLAAALARYGAAASAYGG